MNKWAVALVGFVAGALLIGAAFKGRGILRDRAGRAEQGSPTVAASRCVTRHQAFMELPASEGGVVFLGDSLTDWWSDHPTLWRDRFEAFRTTNLGIAGDRVQNVLWRIQQGEVERVKPRAVVLLIGTNNLGNDPPASIADGVRLILDELRSRCPGARVLLLGIFPRSFGGVDADRRETNALLAKLADGDTVRFVEVAGFKPEHFPDGLHLSPAGYRVWADALAGPLAEMVAR